MDADKKRIAFLEGKLAAQDGVIRELKKEISYLCPIEDVDTIARLILTVKRMEEEADTLQQRCVAAEAQFEALAQSVRRDVSVRMLDADAACVEWACPRCGAGHTEIVDARDGQHATLACGCCGLIAMQVLNVNAAAWCHDA